MKITFMFPKANVKEPKNFLRISTESSVVFRQIADKVTFYDVVTLLGPISRIFCRLVAACRAGNEGSRAPLR